MNANRRRILHLAALASGSWALPGRAAGAVTDRSGSPDRRVTGTAP